MRTGGSPRFETLHIRTPCPLRLYQFNANAQSKRRVFLELVKEHKGRDAELWFRAGDTLRR